MSGQHYSHSQTAITLFPSLTHTASVYQTRKIPARWNGHSFFFMLNLRQLIASTQAHTCAYMRPTNTYYRSTIQGLDLGTRIHLVTDKWWKGSGHGRAYLQLLLEPIVYGLRHWNGACRYCLMNLGENQAVYTGYTVNDNDRNIKLVSVLSPYCSV